MTSSTEMRLQALLTHYDALRAEMLAYINWYQGFQAFTISGAIVALGLVVQFNATPVLLVMPTAFVLAAVMEVRRLSYMTRLSKYLASIEERINACTAVEDLRWDSGAKLGHPKGRYFSRADAKRSKVLEPRWVIELIGRGILAVGATAITIWASVVIWSSIEHGVVRVIAVFGYLAANLSAFYGVEWIRRVLLPRWAEAFEQLMVEGS